MFQLTLVTPERKFVTELDVEEVIVPGYRGQLDILPGHAPLVTTLDPGILMYRPAGQTKYEKAAVSWGYCQVSPVGVNVLAESAERKEDIDKKWAQEALKDAEDVLEKGGLKGDEVQEYQRKAQRARVRLELANEK